jgi:hypothetical protein
MTQAEAKLRLREVVEGIRYLNHFPFGEWRQRYSNLYDRVCEAPLSTSCSDGPLTRLVENLQVELQLRMAEVLLAETDQKS